MVTALVLEALQAARNKLLRKWAELDEAIFNNKRTRKGWVVHSVRKRSLRFPMIGELEMTRRLYRHRVTREFRFFLDEQLGYQKNKIISEQVKVVIRELAANKVSYPAIIQLLAKEGVRICKATISKILNKEELGGLGERVPVPLISRNFYFGIDEGYVPLWVNKKVQLVRGRITSATTGRKVIGKRGEHLAKQYYVSLHSEREIVDNQGYWKVLEKEFHQDYQLPPNTRLWGATDGAKSLQMVVKEAQAIHILSKFHWKRRYEEMSKYEREQWKQANQQTLANWREPDNLGYWSESDVAHVLKGFLGSGNRIWGLQAYKNLLRGKGVRFLKGSL